MIEWGLIFLGPQEHVSIENSSFQSCEIKLPKNQTNSYSRNAYISMTDSQYYILSFSEFMVLF